MKIIIFLLSIVVSTAHAGIFDNRLKVYSCKSEENAHACKECEREIVKVRNKVLLDLEYEFKVDKKANSVLMITYDLNKLESSKFLDGCKVIDSRNWICKTESNYNLAFDRYSQTYEFKMTNGTYTKIIVSYKNGAKSGGNFECGK